MLEIELSTLLYLLSDVNPTRKRIELRLPRHEMTLPGKFILKVPKAELLLLKLIQIFAPAILVMKKLEVEETKTT